MKTKETFSVRELIDSVARSSGRRPFGWRALDDRDIGAAPGDLVIVAGRTGHGKSTVIFNLMCNWLEAHPEETFLLVSHEIPQEPIMLRFLSILTRKRGSQGFSAVHLPSKKSCK